MVKFNLFFFFEKSDEPANCPNVGCAEFIDEMKKLFQYGAKEVMWGFTNKSNIQGDFMRSTRIYDPAKELIIATNNRDKIISKQWTVYKCQTCDFITHAQKKRNTVDRTGGNFDVAVVTSMPVSRRTQHR